MESGVSNSDLSVDLREEVIRTVAAELQEAETPGAAIALYRSGQLLLEAGVGYQDLQQQVPLPADALFYIYSITKPLLAAVALRLVRAGQLDLDTSLQPQLARAGFRVEVPITLRQLLSHTGGIPNYGADSSYGDDLKANPRQPWTTEKFLQVAQAQGLLFPPGQGWAYSNIGYMLLRLILAQETGLSMGDFLAAHLFRPLGLQHTFVAETLEHVRSLTPGYSTFFSENELQNVAPFYHPGWVSHGVVVSTAAELGRLLNGLHSGELLELNDLHEMQKPVYTFDFEHPDLGKIGYGLGLCLGLESEHGTVSGHNGAGPGYSVAGLHFSNLLGHPTTLVALTNRDRIELDLGIRLIFKIISVLRKPREKRP